MLELELMGLVLALGWESESASKMGLALASLLGLVLVLGLCLEMVLELD
jgi:hypothetical protein